MVDDEHSAQRWTSKELIRWYRRGKKKVDSVLRIETLLKKIQNLDLYAKEMMQLHLPSMKRIQYHHYNVVGVETQSSDYNSLEEDAKNAADDCEHLECHEVVCKVDKNRKSFGRKRSSPIGNEFGYETSSESELR